MRTKQQRIELFNDSFQNYKRYQIPKAQLVIADIPYNLAENAYASSPSWYVGGTTRTVKARKQNQHSLILTVISEFPNTCISVQKC